MFKKIKVISKCKRSVEIGKRNFSCIYILQKDHTDRVLICSMNTFVYIYYLYMHKPRKLVGLY